MQKLGRREGDYCGDGIEAVRGVVAFEVDYMHGANHLVDRAVVLAIPGPSFDSEGRGPVTVGASLGHFESIA